MKRLALILSIAFAVALGVVLAFTTPQQRNVGKIQCQNNNYRFRYAAITQGTNQTFCTGGALGVLRTAICERVPAVAGCFRYVPAWRYSYSTPTNATNLWLCWTRKDYRYTVTNGIPYPSRMGCHDFQCFLDTPGGQPVALSQQFMCYESPFLKQCIGIWELPPSVTNGCKIRLVLSANPQTQVGELAIQ